MATSATGRPAGRPAKPVERKRAAGNPGGRALPDAPMPGQGLPSSGDTPLPPPEMGDVGLELWALVWDAGRSWLSPEVDRPIVESLCEAADEAAELRDSLRSGVTPRFYTGLNGQITTHPAVNQLKELRTQRTTWLSMLGFSPADRARLGLAEVRVRDELDELSEARDKRRAASS